ncbi:unnamed protein product [Protopolystoma xenopodis]|uniref:Uncharacterized protein n=1 Tax=Protopolystoma xenopodis TaxID=117903 RepID=A0A3S5A2P9_9PLAT|nr:unnamed protein product [Protopolystoma xenopodis]
MANYVDPKSIFLEEVLTTWTASVCPDTHAHYSFGHKRGEGRDSERRCCVVHSASSLNNSIQDCGSDMSAAPVEIELAPWLRHTWTRLAPQKGPEAGVTSKAWHADEWLNDVGHYSRRHYYL